MSLFDAKYEPVRTYIAALVIPVSTALVSFGIWQADKINIIAGLVLAVLAIPASEAARNRVTPVEKINVTGDIAKDVNARIAATADAVQHQVINTLPGAIREVVETVAHNAVPSQKIDPVPMQPQAQSKHVANGGANPYA